MKQESGRIDPGTDGAPQYRKRSGYDNIPERTLDDAASRWNEKPENRTVEYQFGDQRRRKFEIGGHRPERSLRILGDSSQDDVCQ